MKSCDLQVGKIIIGIPRFSSWNRRGTGFLSPCSSPERSSQSSDRTWRFAVKDENILEQMLGYKERKNRKDLW